ncbi:MAG: hypothetical protein HY043_11660 [Verrucomicrobia bacterium]|nr:hypothetical protein [Verrucomicrobiota bacterium]
MGSYKRKAKQGHRTENRRPGAPPLTRQAPEIEPPREPIAAWMHVVAVLAILGVCVLAYGNNLRGKLVMDDRGILADNEHIRSLTNVPHLFRLNWWAMTPVKGAGAVYRPLAATSYAVDVFLMNGYSANREATDPGSGGLDVRVLHASSIAYHALASCFVYLLLLNLPGLTGRIFAAGWAALLFAAHPVHVEAVSSHVGRAEVLSGLFFFVATATFLYGNRARDCLGWAVGAAMVWLAALLAKEMAVTLPVALVLLEVFQGKKRTFAQWLAIYSPFVVAGIAYALLRHWALTGGALGGSSYEALPLSSVSYVERLFTMTHAFAWYWVLLLAPAWLSADYSGFPVTRSMGAPAFLLSVLVVGVTLAVAAFGLRVRRQGGRKWLGVAAIGILAVYLLLFPISNLLLNTGVVVSERGLYIPSIGLVIAAAAALDQG